MEDFNYKKSFGQNFINDKNIINKIIDCSNIKENSLVIEIGPGSGNLTKELSKVCKNVLAYEIDDRLEEILDEKLVGCDNVTIIFQDFLQSNINDDIKEYNYEHLYITANIPYYITTPIIEKIIKTKLNFENITLMMQKEVGERFSAKPGSKSYGSITVFLNYYFDIKKQFEVSRNLFTPRPNVDSIVITLTLKKDRRANNEDLFFKVVRSAFQYKRKNIRNNLKSFDLKVIEEVLKKYNYDLTVRAEQLSLDVFIDIADELDKRTK
jgi:16S rRNA (adenine1518-N6/adenine1519-N6)-dimethyltransferase